MRAPRLLHNFIHCVGVNDFLLALLLLYLVLDMHRNWEVFHSCDQPIRIWLLGTYALISCLRVARFTMFACTPQPLWPSRAHAVEEFDCLLPSGCLANFTWPVLAIWTCAGTAWTWSAKTQSKLCLAEPRHFLLVASWIVASYTWLIFHALVSFLAWQRNRHLKWIKDNFRAVEDEDMISRWGAVSDEPAEVCMSGGLTAAEISALPCKIVDLHIHRTTQELDCPICLCALRPGESIRPLGSCGHTFHRACIDLWLLRRAECPLCKTSVGKNGSRQDMVWTV